jgi:hypothetical protein
MSELEAVIEAIGAVSAELSGLSEHTRALCAQNVELTTALNLLNSVITRMDNRLGEVATQVSYLRRDVEYLRKNGCETGCPPDEPKTVVMNLPPLHAVKGQ